MASPAPSIGTGTSPRWVRHADEHCQTDPNHHHGHPTPSPDPPDPVGPGGEPPLVDGPLGQRRPDPLEPLAELGLEA